MPDSVSYHIKRLVVNNFNGCNIYGTRFGMNAGKVAFDAKNEQQMISELRAIPKVGYGDNSANKATLKRFLVPLKRGKSVKIAITYPNGDRQCWTSSHGPKAAEPKPYEFYSSDNGTVIIILLYDNGDSQVKVFRNKIEHFVFYSKSGNTSLGVTPGNGDKIHVRPGHYSVNPGQNARGEKTALYLQGERCHGKGNFSTWINQNDEFNGMLMHEDFDSTMEENCKRLILNYRCNKI